MPTVRMKRPGRNAQTGSRDRLLQPLRDRGWQDVVHAPGHVLRQRRQHAGNERRVGVGECFLVGPGIAQAAEADIHLAFANPSIEHTVNHEGDGEKRAERDQCFHLSRPRYSRFCG